MSFRAGKGAYLAIDNVAGSLVDVSQYADNVSFDQPINQLETTTFGDNAREFIPGLTDGGQIQISGPLHVALGTFISALKAAQAAGSASASVIYGPGGSVSGQVRQNAETYVSSYSVSTTVDGRVEFSCSLQVTGSVTNTTW